jgi:flagellar protein FlaH
MSEEAEVEGIETIKTGNEELDRKIGGIPIPSLCLVEGENSSGKSVLVQLMTYGAVKKGLQVHYITTESTITRLIEQMESLSFLVKNYYVSWDLTITMVNTQGLKWNEDMCMFALDILKRFIRYLAEMNGRKLIIVDNITQFVSVARERAILEFFSHMREFVDRSRLVLIITVHPYALNQELLIRIRSICDGNFVLGIKEVSGQVIRTLKVSKLRGARKKIDSIIGFTVDPAFGLKIIPISLAKA